MTWPRVFCNESGQSMVEAAIALPICFLVFLALMEFCFCLYGGTQVASVAKATLNYAAVHGTAADQANTGSGCGPQTSGGQQCSALISAAQAYAAQTAIGSSSAKNITVCAAWWSEVSEATGGRPASACSQNYAYTGDAKAAAPGSFVSVQLVWNYQPLTKTVPISIPLTYTATGAVVY